MATDVDQGYYEWSREEFSDQNKPQDVSIARMLDHGSISFGRFAVESLSWEKRSVFTYNKCQEEVEKFKAPGLVAQKKAYFEEYYRNLRAQKALQESQQTELTMEYGGDGSFSSQTGEEDETASQLEIPRDGEVSFSDGLLEEYKSKGNAEQEMNCSQPLERPLDFEFSNLESARSSMGKIQLEKNSDKAGEMHNSDTGFMGQRLLTRQTEVTEQNDHNNIEDKGMSRMEEFTPSYVGPKVALQGTALSSRTGRVGISNLEPPQNSKQEKTKKMLQKSREAHTPIAKKPASSVKNGMKLEPKTKTDLQKSSQPLIKSRGKVESSFRSSKQSADRVARNKKPIPELHSGVTIPRPFSFATERRATVPAGIRETTSRTDSKISSRLESSRLLAKSSICVQINDKKRAITSGVKVSGPGNSVHEDVRKTALAMESRCSIVRGSAGNMLRTQNARSVNLPSQCTSNHNVRTKIRLMSKAEELKGKEGKGDARLRIYQGVKTKTTNPLGDKSPGMEDKKMAASQNGNPSGSARRPRTADLSLGRSKLRKEIVAPQTRDPLVSGRPRTADLSQDRRKPRKETVAPQTGETSVSGRPRTADLSQDRRKPRKEMPRWR